MWRTVHFGCRGGDAPTTAGGACPERSRRDAGATSRGPMQPLAAEGVGAASLGNDSAGIVRELLGLG
jgi:hypothetical protein